MKDITRDVARPKKLRSAMTNDPYRLPGIDMRTRRGRRWRDIVDALISEFGSSNPVGLRELAGLKFSLEETQAEVVKGNGKAREDLVLSVVDKILLSFAQANNLTIGDKVMKVVYQSTNSLRGKIVRKGHVFNNTLKSVYRKNSSEVTKPDVELENPNRTYRKSIKNGIAIFAINAEGKIARSPDQVFYANNFVGWKT
jgi:hypothetical protein